MPVRRLSEHYTLADFTFSETALRHGIDNTPPPAVIKHLIELAYVLEDIERRIGWPPHVLSGYRCAKLNALIKGDPNSAHLEGLAADIRCPRFGSALDLCMVIAASTIKYDQIIHEYGAWCHIAIGGQVRKMNLTKEKGKSYTLGLF